MDGKNTASYRYSSRAAAASALSISPDEWSSVGLGGEEGGREESNELALIQTITVRK